MSQVGTVHEFMCAEDQCVPARKVVEVPVLVCLRNSCYHVTGVEDRKVCETRAESFHAK